VNITLFGATGALGGECLKQALAGGHAVTVLVRNADKLAPELTDGMRAQITVVEGDGLSAEDVASVITIATDAVLFAIGVDKHSPENLCTDINRHIFSAMADVPCKRFIWCGGGSNFVEQDQITFGARFVKFFAETFMGLRHRDKEEQFRLLAQHPEIDWFGLRPLQMNEGPLQKTYRLGFDEFSGLSQITFADCAHAMLGMLTDDTWLRKAPIIQY
jgi:putative NADH-flavin reductase